jgi:hypothetical protein
VVKLDATPVLPAGLRVKTTDDEYIITCSTCGTAWAVPRGRGIENGRLLTESDRHVSKWCPELRLVNGR